MLKSRIAKADARTIQAVPVPQWGFDVLIRSWTPKEIAEFRVYFKDYDERLKANPNDDRLAFEILGYVLVRSLCEADGSLCFDETAISQLYDKDLNALRTIFDAIFALNRLRPDDVAQAKKN